MIKALHSFRRGKKWVLVENYSRRDSCLRSVFIFVFDLISSECSPPGSLSWSLLCLSGGAGCTCHAHYEPSLGQSSSCGCLDDQHTSWDESCSSSSQSQSLSCQSCSSYSCSSQSCSSSCCREK